MPVYEVGTQGCRTNLKNGRPLLREIASVFLGNLDNVLKRKKRY